MTEFRGRGDEIHIAPLAFSEYYPASGKDKLDAWNEYLYYGGLPHILAEPDSESKVRYLERLNKEIYMRDLSERYDIRYESEMEKLMKVFASSVGSLSNARKISDTFKGGGDNQPVWRNEEGITVMGIFDFMLDENSLELQLMKE